MTDKPTIAQDAPFPVEVTEGKTYFWCACGRSAKQPFCDGSHKGTEFKPEKVELAEEGRMAFCQCKRSGSQPQCDGSHRNL